jgi:hypothetical protein
VVAKHGADWPSTTKTKKSDGYNIYYDFDGYNIYYDKADDFMGCCVFDTKA